MISALMSIYEPAEDSFLLQQYVKEYATGRVLDLGTGSGIQAFTAIAKGEVREVVAVDINTKAVQEMESKIKEEKLRKIKAVRSDLFEHISGAFNTIIFNPPYLPQDKGIEDKTLYGGKKGWELIERFFEGVEEHLFPDGIVLLLFSSLTNKQKVDEIIEQHLYAAELLGRKKMAFEELYVYKVVKTPLRLEFERRGMEKIAFFAQGKRGRIFTGRWNKNITVKSHFSKKELVKVALKVEREDSIAIERLANEAKWLQRLNKEEIGPHFLFAGKNYVGYEFVEGRHIMGWMEKASREEVIWLLKDVLEQCYLMDKMGVNKEEMHHPVKHILVNGENRPILIDFERCVQTEHPQNVTQFVEFWCRIGEVLQKKGIVLAKEKLRQMAKGYKDTLDEAHFQQILGMVR